MGAEKRLLPIKEAFQLAQQPHQNQAKLVVALSRTYHSVSDAARGTGPPPLPSPARPSLSRGLPATFPTPRTKTPTSLTFSTWFGEAHPLPSPASSQRPPARTVNPLAVNLEKSLRVPWRPGI